MYEGFMIEIANTAQHKYSSVLTFGFVTTDSSSGRWGMFQWPVILKFSVICFMQV